MPWGVAAAVAGSAVSSALAPSPSGGGGSSGQYYIPTGLGTADTQWQGLQTGNYNTYGQTSPGIQGAAGQSFNAGQAANQDYGWAYQNAAGNAGNQYTNLGTNLQGAAQQDFNAQGALGQAGAQVMNTAFDPQSALYNRTYQQLQDQTGATNSMYGLGSSAAGAGVANQALGNFNIDWQNQQLQRQTQGLQAYGAALGQGSTIAGQGGALGGAGAGYTLQGGQVPYQTGQTIAGMPGQLGSTYANQLNTGVYGPAQGIQGQAIPYMNYGQGAQAVPYQQQVQGAGAAGALASQGITSLGSNPQVQSALGSAFGGSGQSFSGNFGGMASSSPYYSGGGGNAYGFTM
jgi:hypothetical protein